MVFVELTETDYDKTTRKVFVNLNHVKFVQKAKEGKLDYYNDKTQLFKGCILHLSGDDGAIKVIEPYDEVTLLIRQGEINHFHQRRDQS